MRDRVFGVVAGDFPGLIRAIRVWEGIERVVWGFFR